MPEETSQQIAETIPQKVPLTRINKLVLEGFKSFARRTELLFGENFNIVLGANGSGKSNVMDAICFVLGKSSSKSMRAEKSAHLIYNGGKSKQPAKFAEVSIFFDNSNKAFPLPEEEVRITRTVAQDGASKYKINNKTKTRQEVLECLGAARINPDGYNIILQGDIVRLVEMSPVERRQIVEEIAGIGIYEEKKNQALNELEKVELRLKEASIVLKERETYLKELKKDRDQALQYKKVNDDLKTWKASIVARKKEVKESQINELEKKASVFQEKIDRAKKECGKLREEMQFFKSEIARISAEIEQKGEVEQIKLQKEIEKLHIEVETKKARLQFCVGEVSRIEQRLGVLQKNMDDLDRKLVELKHQQKILLNQLDEKSVEKVSVEKALNDFRKHHKIESQSEWEKQLEAVEREGDELEKQLQDERTKQQEVVRELDRLDFQRSSCDDRVKQFEELEKEHQGEVKQLRDNREALKKCVFELNEVLNKDADHARQLGSLRLQLATSKTELGRLQVKHAQIEESAAGNAAVKRIISVREKIGGVYGTVAELGNVDSKYALALEVAASQRIQSVVVEDETVAIRCINILKKEKVGTASFLPLNKIKPIKENENLKKLLKIQGVVGKAIDCVEFDPKFRNVFSHVFGNTLVVDGIETAKKVGVGTERMVTLDGDLVEFSGAMIGGYRTRKTAGGFREKSLIDELRKQEAAVAELEEAVASLENTRQQADEMIQRLREKRAEFEGELIKLERSLHTKVGDVDAELFEKSRIEKRIEEIKAALLVHENAVSELIAKATDVKVKKQEFRGKISESRNPAVLAELGAFDQKHRELSEAVVKLSAEAKNLDFQIQEVVEKEKENLDKIYSDAQKERTQFLKEKDELQKFVLSIEKVVKEKEREQQQFYAQFKDLFDQRNKMTDQLNLREQKLFTNESAMRQEEIGLNGLTIEMAREKAECAGLQVEFEQFGVSEVDKSHADEELQKMILQGEQVLISIGNVNLRALEVYDVAEKEYGVLIEKKSVLDQEKKDVVNLMGEIEKNKKELFTRTLQVVDTNFKRFFSGLTVKGEAFLELENPEMPFEEGLRIRVRLSGEKFLDIRGLSGGEKTLTALAFLFAIQEHEPASFYVFDEVDAALDRTNSEKLANLIKSYSSRVQYVVISHNDGLISQGDVLYGVSMDPESGTSSIVGIKL